MYDKQYKNYPCKKTSDAYKAEINTSKKVLICNILTALRKDFASFI